MITNQLPTKKLNIAACLLSLGFVSSSFAQDYIAPPMVNIPAGSFDMGTNIGAELAKPMHKVTLAAFQLAKYPVTMAEFRKFAEDTNYQAKSTCDDYVGENWMSGPGNQGTVSWEDHRYVISEYQPVSCIGFQDARNYATWLSKKTGVNYRIPTEQEWEYATKANTTSRYFWGDDPNLTQACLYGNFPDQSGEYFPSEEFGASYHGYFGYANCDDGEPYVTLVGMYRPNPFGLYDMLGNMSQYLASCYYPGYQHNDNKEMDIEKCETIAHRGFDWHYPPQPHYERGRTTKEWSHGSDIGFRLAVDGHSNRIDPSTKQFEKALETAQQERIATRPRLPIAPQNNHLIKLNESSFELRWQLSNDHRVTSYDIYQSKSEYAHLRAGHFKKFYTKLTTVDSTINSIQLTLPNEGASYQVVAVTPTLDSLPSNIAISTPVKVETIPGRVNTKNAYATENALLSTINATEDKPELLYLSKFVTGYEQNQVTADFKINVERSGWYQLNYYGRSDITGEFFKLWRNNQLIASVDYAPEAKDRKTNKVYLPKGNHNLQLTIVREGYDFWGLGWIDFSEIKG